MANYRGKKIFKDFENVSKETWLKLAIIDLKEKGQSLDSIEDGFDLVPFYTKEDVNSSFFYENPVSNHKEWKYLEYINLKDQKKANHHALFSLNNGAEGIIFNLNLHNNLDFKKLLEGVYPEHCNLLFDLKEYKAGILNQYFKYLSDNNIPYNQINGGVKYDPLAEWTLNPIRNFPPINSLTEIFNVSHPYENFRCFSISSEIFKNSGATMVQEAALTISSFIAYIKELSNAGVPPESIFKKAWFIISVGQNYFFEIAKLRALRTLILQIAKAYQIENFTEQELNLHVETAWWTKTAKDPYTNILRNTTEAMAGILGGCSSLSIHPHDIILKEHNEFSSRISRNISNILREESYFNKVYDPLAGSYYIKNLTQIMLQRIWDHVQDIEKQGGFVTAFKNGYIKNLVAPNYQKFIDSVLNSKKKIVGSNFHENQEDIEFLSDIQKSTRGWFEWDRLTKVLEQKKE